MPSDVSNANWFGLDGAREQSACTVNHHSVVRWICTEGFGCNQDLAGAKEEQEKYCLLFRGGRLPTLLIALKRPVRRENQHGSRILESKHIVFRHIRLRVVHFFVYWVENRSPTRDNQRGGLLPIAMGIPTVGG